MTTRLPLCANKVEMDQLPAIPQVKCSLVEAAKRGVRSAPCFEDSGLDLAASASVAPPRAAPQALFVTRSFSPRPPSTPMKRSVEYVRLSRNEVDRRDHSLSSLRTENLQLQARIREMERFKEGYSSLHSACGQLAKSLGYSTEGVAAASIGDMLTARVNRITHDHTTIKQQLEASQGDLEHCRGELAAASVRVTSLESQLTQKKHAVKSKDSELKQLKLEVDEVKEARARANATIQSLRQQLTEASSQTSSSSFSAVSPDVARLQTEVGRLTKELTDREDGSKCLELQLQVKQQEIESLEERICSSDDMYGDLCTQLVVALQLNENDSFDVEYLTSQVSAVVQEYGDVKLRLETTTKSIKAAELDAKASRETILRLVSEIKKHEKNAEEILKLQQSQEELKCSLLGVEKERNGLQERLMAAKETLAAQERELQNKETRLEEMKGTVHSMQQVFNSESATVESAQAKFDEFCKAIATMVGSHSTDSGALLDTLKELAQAASKNETELSRLTSSVTKLESSQQDLQRRLKMTEEELQNESAKVVQLEGEIVSIDIVKEGMERQLEKHKAFCKNLAKAVQLDAATSRIVSGDFAEDAILAKAEQLAKHETQALADRQTAVYALQRKLKASRSSLESKELQLGMLQKKVAAMEGKALAHSNKEAEWESACDKVRRQQKQLERLQHKVTQQTEIINRLKAENVEAQALKARCNAQETRLTSLTASVEELSQVRVQQAQQLAEARRKVQAVSSRDKREQEQLEKDAKAAQAEVEQAREREKEFCVFKATVQRLLKNAELDDQEARSSSGLDTIARLEGLIASHAKHKETAKCLQASLKQLEVGFNTNYSDALTLLQDS